MFKHLLALALLFLGCANQAAAVQPDDDNHREYSMPAYKSSFVVSPEVY